jgi:ubiquinone/menaquinone biosynthesis C-methylase UbiE
LFLAAPQVAVTWGRLVDGHGGRVRLAGVEGYDARSYGDGFADVYDDWYAEVSDVAGTVARVTELANDAGGRRVLELGVGTGRLALPLAATGLEVTGIDASEEMLQRLRAKPGSEGVQAVLGDMATLPVDGTFAVVFVAFNTFFNLTTQAAQQACLHRVAEVVDPGGYFVVEAFVPPEPGSAPDSGVSVRSIEVDHVVLTAARRTPSEQTITGQHIEISEQGIKLRPWVVRYATPQQLDEMAAWAGLTLVSRHGDWARTPFDDASGAHVSVYRNGDR